MAGFKPTSRRAGGGCDKSDEETQTAIKRLLRFNASVTYLTAFDSNFFRLFEGEVKVVAKSKTPLITWKDDITSVEHARLSQAVISSPFALTERKCIFLRHPPFLQAIFSSFTTIILSKLNQALQESAFLSNR